MRCSRHPNPHTQQGQKDHALLLFLYNSGARASEAAGVKISGLEGDERRGGAVRLCGKGAKTRLCPLWPRTMAALAPLIAGRPQDSPVFVNRYGAPVTRFGIHTLVERHAKQARERVPSLAKKRVSPHTIRHTTATHLLRAGVDINTIRAWLGHVSIDTTNVYAEVDLEMKAKALAACDTGGKRHREKDVAHRTRTSWSSFAVSEPKSYVALVRAERASLRAPRGEHHINLCAT